MDELLAILRTLAKTVVFVTHDMDEALRMADRIAFMREGRLVQYASPAAILTHPADDFVGSFVGSDRALRRLALVTVGEAMAADATAPPASLAALAVPSALAAPSSRAAPAATTPLPAIPITSSLREALAQMLAQDRDGLAVTDAQGRVVGHLTLAGLRAHATLGASDREAPG